jgi:hypothetical protein
MNECRLRLGRKSAMSALRLILIGQPPAHLLVLALSKE